MPAQDTARARVSVDGKFFRLAGRKFYAKGVTYGPFAPNAAGDCLPERAQQCRDFDHIRRLGANAIRLYFPPPRTLLDDALDRAGGIYFTCSGEPGKPGHSNVFYIAADGTITPRCIIVGLLLSVVFSFIIPYVDVYLSDTFLGAQHLPPGAVFMLFALVVLVNPLLRAIGKRLPFSRVELLMIYCMLLFSTLVPGITALPAAGTCETTRPAATVLS